MKVLALVFQTLQHEQIHRYRDKDTQTELIEIITYPHTQIGKIVYFMTTKSISVELCFYTSATFHVSEILDVTLLKLSSEGFKFS